MNLLQIRGLFLKSRETFISSQRRGSKPSNFTILLAFLTCQKISFSKRAYCSSNARFSDLKNIGNYI